MSILWFYRGSDFRDLYLLLFRLDAHRDVGGDGIVVLGEVAGHDDLSVVLGVLFVHPLDGIAALGA